MKPWVLELFGLYGGSGTCRTRCGKFSKFLGTQKEVAPVEKRTLKGTLIYRLIHVASGMGFFESPLVFGMRSESHTMSVDSDLHPKALNLTKTPKQGPTPRTSQTNPCRELGVVAGPWDGGQDSHPAWPLPSGAWAAVVLT